MSFIVKLLLSFLVFSLGDLIFILCGSWIYFKKIARELDTLCFFMSTLIFGFIAIILNIIAIILQLFFKFPYSNIAIVLCIILIIIYCVRICSTGIVESEMEELEKARDRVVKEGLKELARIVSKDESHDSNDNNTDNHFKC